MGNKRDQPGKLGALGFKIFSRAARRHWSAQIKAFERKDRENLPSPGGIVFVGSSTFAFWDTLEKDMAPLPVIRRGFGGSTIQDVIYYAPRIVIPYKPKIVVLYAGDNDIFIKHKFGLDARAARDCLDDVHAFVTAVHGALPGASIYFVSIKPSPSRQDIWPLMADANAMVKDYMASDPRLNFIDTTLVMFDDEGRIRRDLFKDDMLHLNGKGYALWTSIIKPQVTAVHETAKKKGGQAAGGEI